jgi:putative phage-type endonuclease
MNILDHCTVIPLWDEVTGDPISEAAWHQIRKQGVGGSDAGTLCGVNKYDSVYHLWCMKSGIAQPTDAGEPAEWGHILEKPVAEKYAKDTGQALVEWAVTLRSIEYPFMQANLDFVTVDPCELFPAGKVTTWKRKAPPVGITAIYEGKTGAIASPGSPKDWLETPESIPETYACQGAHYCAVSGLRLVKYGCLLGGHGLVKREMQVSEEFVESLIEVTRSFWEDHVLTGTPPEVDGSDATDEALKGAYPRSVEGTTVERNS